MKFFLTLIYSLNTFAGGNIPFMFFPISTATSVSSSSCDPAATMLIHMNGTVGSNSFSDCTGNVTLANSSTPKIQSSGMFQQAGLFSTGTLTANSQSAISLGSSDFTIEYWVKPTSGSVPGLVINGSAQGSAYAAIAFNESGGIYFSTNGTTWAGSVTLTLTDGVWSHIAISRTAAKISVFKNGIAAGSYSVGAGVSLYTGTYNTFGAYGGGSTGYMDELRIVKGYGKYTGTFTPPTIEFGSEVSTCDSLATMLVHMNGTVGSNSFSDCTGNVTLTNVSTPAIQTVGVFNQSGYFSAGYLSANSQSAIALGSSDFTVEFWLKPTSGSSPGLIINGSAQTSGYAAIAVSESGVVTFSTNGTSWASTTNLSLTNSVWSHIAISRYGSTIGVFKNGTAVGSYTVGDGISLYAGTYNTIGAYTGSSTGYMDELRLVKGSAKYSGTFTQPYAEFGSDPCSGSNPVAGTLCSSGTLYLGSLSPGALSGSGTDKYMTTPGGCGEIPTAQKTVGINAGAGDYPNALFTPTCSGSTDALTKYWNDGSSNWYVVPGLVDYTTSAATDQNYGSTNTTNIVAITVAGQGGYHAAARYCKNLNYGGYTDWYLPNRAELNLMYVGYSSIQGLTNSYYWSSTEYSNMYPWTMRPNDGTRTGSISKNAAYLVRCVRKY